MKLPPNKSEIRQQLEQEMEAFLAKGGAVDEIPRGKSAMEPGQMVPISNSFPQNTSKPKRESLLHVTQAIDDRRRSLRSKTSDNPRLKTNKSPGKVAVYDDFGEIIRWEWRAS